MASYENGSNTRRLILDTCKKLFYEKGYRTVSMTDIYKACFINRASLYYHFKDKETIRYEVHYELYIQNKNWAKSFCDKPEYHFLLAIYLFFYQLLHDPQTRRFLVEYVEDNILYDPASSAAVLYQICCKQMYGNIWQLDHISPLSFASVYGHNNCLILMAAQHPEKFTALDLFQQTMLSGTLIWGISSDQSTALWNALLPYIEALPTDTFDTSLL